MVKNSDLQKHLLVILYKHFYSDNGTLIFSHSDLLCYLDNLHETSKLLLGVDQIIQPMIDNLPELIYQLKNEGLIDIAGRFYQFTHNGRREALFPKIFNPEIFLSKLTDLTSGAKKLTEQLASIAFIYIPTLANEPNNRVHEMAVFLLHRILEDKILNKESHELSKNSDVLAQPTINGSILIAPDYTACFIHEYLIDVVESCKKFYVPLRIGVIHGIVSFLKDDKSITYLGRLCHLASEIARHPRNPNILFDSTYTSFVQGMAVSPETDPGHPKYGQPIKIDKFTCQTINKNALSEELKVRDYFSLWKK